VAIEADVTDADQLHHGISQAAQAMGGLDGLVNAAGILHVEEFEESHLESWKAMLDVNLTGVYLSCKAAVPHLRHTAEATIVNIASGIGLHPLKGYAGYAASKAGVIALSKVLAMELAPSIRVNSVCPGAIDTPMIKGLSRTVASSYALGRIGEAREVADAVLYLSGPESSFVTGVALAVDGGRTFH
jgi:NAD(P)-dependent dehydrogenase (short-subunit alcohol dehydrogenase family)